MINLGQRFINAIDNGSLKLIEGKRSWYNYIISIQKLVWTRNMIDGYKYGL